MTLTTEQKLDILWRSLNRIHRTLSVDAGGRPSNRDGSGDWQKAGIEAREEARRALCEAEMGIQT